MTTTTLNAVNVMQHLEYLLQVEWPELEVFATSVTEQWAAAALSGPDARKVLARLVTIDVSNEAFPFLAVSECKLHARGEPYPGAPVSYELFGRARVRDSRPATRGREMWEAVIAAGGEFGIMPYGTEAMSTLRIEKGHVVVGPEADGRTTADDLGMGKLVSAAKWCIGKPLLARPAFGAPAAGNSSAFTAIDGSIHAVQRSLPIPNARRRSDAGPRQLVVLESEPRRVDRAGAALADGRARATAKRCGQCLRSPMRARRCGSGPPCFIDPEGARLRVLMQ